ncbi:hypothetical protein ACIQGO_42045 [Streptomyces shenzhenensis]|uniref:hypothetical protein n=1 Tax=Streptomyces shenzhenensis TaxID=943815 RepID=UPI0038070976
MTFVSYALFQAPIVLAEQLAADGRPLAPHVNTASPSWLATVRGDRTQRSWLAPTADSAKGLWLAVDQLSCLWRAALSTMAAAYVCRRLGHLLLPLRTARRMAAFDEWRETLTTALSAAK